MSLYVVANSVITDITVSRFLYASYIRASFQSFQLWVYVLCEMIASIREKNNQ